MLWTWELASFSKLWNNYWHKHACCLKSGFNSPVSSNSPVSPVLSAAIAFFKALYFTCYSEYVLKFQSSSKIFERQWEAISLIFLNRTNCEDEHEMSNTMFPLFLWISLALGKDYLCLCQVYWFRYCIQNWFISLQRLQKCPSSTSQERAEVKT